MPALTMVARRLANSRSTKSSNSLPVSTAGVQLFFSSASAQALDLVALTHHVGQRLALLGVMPGAP
jgi:ABC-type transport system involved in cytochrome bd biosynthesis fused ATPase/permease subunit